MISPILPLPPTSANHGRRRALTTSCFRIVAADPIVPSSLWRPRPARAVKTSLPRCQLCRIYRSFLLYRLSRSNRLFRRRQITLLRK